MKVTRIDDCDVQVGSQIYCTGQFTSRKQAARRYDEEARRCAELARFLREEEMAR